VAARADNDGEQQADGQQSGWQTCVMAHLLQLLRRGVGEQQQGQGEFG
jgi:hypothetical protein